MKLWHQDQPRDPWLEQFLAADDQHLDQRLTVYDCRGSLAHARMLRRINILTPEELAQLERGLNEIAQLAANGAFPITAEDEDCHTAIENYLVKMCGDAGRKIHTGRSRNDQVLTALRLFEKDQLREMHGRIESFREALGAAIDRLGNIPLPGYTHMQRAMPTTVAIWLGSFLAATEDDLELLGTVQHIIDQSPLGTAAGFGVPVLKIDRESTARELGFARVQENPLYAQLSRGKFEALLLGLCSQVMLGLNRLASDLLQYSTREFGFVRLPERLCTGSSLMPQKRNPDILELVRGRFHVVAGEEMKIKNLTAGLMSGYNRDVQLTKGPLFAGLDTTLDCLHAMSLVVGEMTVDELACRKALTDELYATERAHRLVSRGIPFRAAYRSVAQEEAKKYSKIPEEQSNDELSKR